MYIDECSTIISASAGELYPSSIGNLNRGHSRQASKSSVSLLLNFLSEKKKDFS
jgi:hypothetical protein